MRAVVVVRGKRNPPPPQTHPRQNPKTTCFFAGIKINAGACSGKRARQDRGIRRAHATSE